MDKFRKVICSAILIVLASSVSIKRFVGGELNACYNCIDRHIAAGLGEKTAIIYDSPTTHTVRKVSYRELHDKVSKLAGGMRKLGVEKGDRVVIYMPLIPEVVIAILATVRIGAIHSVVFGGKSIVFHFLQSI